MSGTAEPENPLVHPTSASSDESSTAGHLEVQGGPQRAGSGPSRHLRLVAADEGDLVGAEAAPAPPPPAPPVPWVPLFTAGPLWRLAVVWVSVLGGTVFVIAASRAAGAPLPITAALAWLPVLYVIDISVLRLPTPFVWASGVSALAASAVEMAAGDLTVGRALGAAACAAVTFLVFATAYVFLPPGSFGLGDLRLAVVIAYAVATQGYLDVVMAMWVIAPLSAVLYALGLGWFRSALPYGPALITGAVTVAAWPGLFVPSLS